MWNVPGLQRLSVVRVAELVLFRSLYWELDGGGTAARVVGRPAAPDLAFAQTQDPELAWPGWRPEFVDYVFVAFTAGTSFGPTDVAVLSRRLKLAVTTQTAVALVVVVLVVARAVNVLA